MIEAGDSYSYASGCPLGASSGSMVGAYYMTDVDGRMFEAAIPAFSLDVPDTRRVLN
ncbi:CO2+/MG2+ efflux protein ApaG [compost metagenome]